MLYVLSAVVPKRGVCRSVCPFREALDIQYDVLNILKMLEEEHQFPKISVELVDNEPSLIYSACKKSTQVS